MRAYSDLGVGRLGGEEAFNVFVVGLFPLERWMGYVVQCQQQQPRGLMCASKYSVT